MGDVGVVTFFVLEVPDYESAMLIYIYKYIYIFTHTHTHTHTHPHEPLAHLEARRLWCDITIHNFATRFARCSLVAPSALPKIME